MKKLFVLATIIGITFTMVACGGEGKDESNSSTMTNEAAPSPTISAQVDADLATLTDKYNELLVAVNEAYLAAKDNGWEANE